MKFKGLNDLLAILLLLSLVAPLLVIGNAAVTATVLTAPSVSDSVSRIVNVAEENSYLSLAHGWNLVCFRLVSENSTPNNVFTGLKCPDNYIIYYWNAPYGPYSEQGTDQPLKDNRGYWVWVNQSMTIMTSGIHLVSKDIHLVRGWNLVGFPVTNRITTPNNIFIGLNYPTDYIIYYWNAPYGPYSEQGTDQPLKDNRGYWVWVNQDKTVTVPVPPAGLANTPWPKFKHDIGNTGQGEYVGAQDNTLKWSYNIGDAVDSSPAIGLDGTIYVGAFDGKLYAFNPDGTFKWSFATGDKIHSSPAINQENTIYIGSNDGYLYAVNPNGTLKWSNYLGQVYSPPTIDIDNTIYVGSRSGYLYAIRKDGTIKWSFGPCGYIYSCPAIADDDGTIYFGAWDGYLHALNPDGTSKWSYRIGSYIYASPAIGEDGTIYVGSAPGTGVGGTLYAFNPDGTFKWSFLTSARIYSSAAIGPDGTVYVGSDDGNLYALYDNGSLKWSYNTGGSVQSSPAVDANGNVYVGSSRGMFAFNPDGTLKWFYATSPTMGAVVSSPAIDADGTIYFGSVNGNLYAIKNP
jgi:outer membrane protein assembly factor BamB